MKIIVKEKIGEKMRKNEERYLYYFPEGLIGLENLKEFYFLVRTEELPFYWMVSKNENFSFFVVSPFIICPNYIAEIPDEEINFLEIKDEKEIVLSVIVNRKEFTANLIAPIVLNQNKNIGKQVIIANYKDYSVNFPINYAYIIQENK